MTKPWPYPGDSPLDRARRVARTYRNALHQEAPELCEQLDERARQLGMGWVTPQPLAYEPDDLLTAAEVAEMCHVQPATVRQWRHRGMPAVDSPEGWRFVLSDVLDYHAERRKRRAGRAFDGS